MLLQWDLRKEFDVRRSGRSVKPAMSLNQTSYFTEIKYKGYLSSDWEVSSGVQLNRKDNYNETGYGYFAFDPRLYFF